MADNPMFYESDVHVPAKGFTALSAAAEVCEHLGFDPLILSSSVRGKAREVTKTYVTFAEELLATDNLIEPPTAVLSDGETTVTIRGDGTGGPN